MILDRLRTYLSGSIDRTGTSQYPFWTEKEVNIIKHRFQEKGKLIEVINPNNSDYQNRNNDMFKVDFNNIILCNFIIVELSNRRGIGVGAEMLHSQLNGIPVFSICPENSYYCKQGWIHPFVKSLSTKIFKNLDESLDFITEIKFKI